VRQGPASLAETTGPVARRIAESSKNTVLYCQSLCGATVHGYFGIRPIPIKVMRTVSFGASGATNSAQGDEPQDGASVVSAMPAATDLETFGCQIDALISPK